MTARETIIANPGMNTLAIAKLCGVSVKTIQNTISLMKHSGMLEECEKVGLPAENVGNYWYKGKHYSIHVKAETQKTYLEMKDDIIAEMQKYAPKYPVIKYPKRGNAHLMVIDPADVHIGKLCSAFETGEEYNSQIAVKRIREGVAGVLEKANGFPKDKILFIVGNDILHVDGPTNTTTKGTRQDVDGMWYDNFMMAKRIYIETIEMLSTIAPITVQYDPSNHDVMSGFFLADTLKSWFHKSKNIEFNVSTAHRKYFRYGKNLIGTTHGDAAPIKELPLLMANEAKMDWALTDHHYIYTHHIHHKESKDYKGVTVESLRSPSEADGWHDRNGHNFAPKAIEAFIHHPNYGQIARFTHLF